MGNNHLGRVRRSGTIGAMMRRYAPVVTGIWRADGEPIPPVPDAMVWDVDGVLVDTSRSYPRVVTEATAILLDMAGASGRGSTVSTRDIRLLKALSGFNSDWTLTKAVVIASLVLLPRLGGRREAVRRSLTTRGYMAQARRAGGGADGLLRPLVDIAPSAVEAARSRAEHLPVDDVCESLYGGPETEQFFGHPSVLRHPGEGLWRRERARITADSLAVLSGMKHGIYTGRMHDELLPALAITGLEQVVPRHARMTPGEGVEKPDPEGLRRLARVLNARSALYVGDNVDDIKTVTALRSAGDRVFHSVGMLGGVLGAGARKAFATAGADLLASDPVTLVNWLADRRL